MVEVEVANIADGGAATAGIQADQFQAELVEMSFAAGVFADLAIQIITRADHPRHFLLGLVILPGFQEIPEFEGPRGKPVRRVQIDGLSAETVALDEFKLIIDEA